MVVKILSIMYFDTLEGKKPILKSRNLLDKGRRQKKNMIFHDIDQNSFDTYPPNLIMT